MTQETVERLDYSKAPLGYAPAFGRRLGNFGADVGWWFGTTRYDTETAALAAAWSHYKERSDPPGLDVSEWGFGQRKIDEPWWRPPTAMEPDLASSRAAAWAWYDRRLALADRLESLGFVSSWPALLTWADDKVAGCERWSMLSRFDHEEHLSVEVQQREHRAVRLACADELSDLEGVAGMEALRGAGESARAIARLTKDMRTILRTLWEREEAGRNDAYLRQSTGGWMMPRDLECRAFVVATVNALWGDGYLAQAHGTVTARYVLTAGGRAMAERLAAEESNE